MRSGWLPFSEQCLSRAEGGSRSRSAEPRPVEGVAWQELSVSLEAPLRNSTVNPGSDQHTPPDRSMMSEMAILQQPIRLRSLVTLVYAPISDFAGLE
jgi:hypothetical protein